MPISYESPEGLVAVPPEGPTDCKIALVGEAPGMHEVSQRRPFVGKSGGVLNQELTQAGIVRSECYITNVLKWLPPKLSDVIELSERSVFRSPEYDRAEEELYEELNSVEANVLVAIGAVATYALTGRHYGQLKDRGSILPTVAALKKTTKVVPIVHPSYSLRGNYLSRLWSVHDLRFRVLPESKTHSYDPPRINTIVRPSFTEACLFLQDLHQCKEVAWDIEVDMKRDAVTCISFCGNGVDSMSIPLCAYNENYFSPDQEVEIWRNIRALLEDPAVMKIGQNIIFDCTYLAQRYGIIPFPLEDTMNAQAFITTEMPKGLDFLCSIYTRIPYYKADGKTYNRIGGEIESFWRYNAMDSAATWQVWQEIQKDLDHLGNRPHYRNQTDLIPSLIYMTTRGLRVEEGGLRARSEEAQQELVDLLLRIRKHCGEDFKPLSSPQVMKYFYVDQGHRPYLKHGKPSADEEALVRIARKGHEEAQLILDYRRLNKLKSTYLDVELGDDGRLHGAFKPVGTDSGRLSCTQTYDERGANLQNLDRRVWRHVLADEGYYLYNIDLSQADNRVVAYVAPEPRMIEAFEAGIDVHARTAALIFHKNIDEISDEPNSSPIGGGKYSERFWGKKANHSLNYGQGLKTFALKCEVTEAEAKPVYEGYFRAYPGVRLYRKWIEAQLRDNRRLVTPFGQTRKFLDAWGDDLVRRALSYIPQNTVAFVINNRGINFLRENQDAFQPVELLDQIHDSILVQIPISIGLAQHAAILKKIIESMEQPIPWKTSSFVIPVDVKVGPALDYLATPNELTPDAIAVAYEAALKEQRDAA